MSTPIKAPYLPYDRLRAKADAFLEEYWDCRAVPVPIDDIAEQELGINIVPIKGLKKGFDIESWVSHDLTEIHVDEGIYLGSEVRYRFSVAHEVGHIILHREVFELLDFSSVAEWKQQQLVAIPAEQYRFIEFQAYGFAGLVLVPGDRLAEAFRAAEDVAAEAGFSVAEMDAKQRAYLAVDIAKKFRVSKPVIEKRLEKDGHC